VTQAIKQEFIRDPRIGIKELVRRGDLVGLLAKAAELHGHFCVGLSLGVLASYVALKKFEILGPSIDLTRHARQEFQAIVENNLCFADGVQIVLGTTLGNDALILRDTGKNAVTLIHKESRKLVRVAMVNEASEALEILSDEKFRRYFERVMMKGEQLSSEEFEEFRSMMDKASLELLSVEPERLFKIEEGIVEKTIETAREPRKWIKCSGCGELVLELKTKVREGKILCTDCANEPVNTLAGRSFTVARLSDILKISATPK
jgi:formylmethanofuran dehydrogenase subunit E